MKDLLFIVGGFASGVFSGALGVGGAALATPIVRALGVSPLLAIGSTVPAILPSTLTGAFTYARSGLVDRRSVALTAAGGVPSVIAGAVATRVIPGDGHLLMVATAIVLLYLSLRLIPSKGDVEPDVVPRSSSGALIGLGVGSGLLSGLLGIGGGFMMVPVFIKVLGLPTKVALGTSLAVITITVIPNAVAQSTVGNIDWKVALLLAVGVVPGARIGALLAIRTKQRTLRVVLALGLAAVAVLYGAFEAIELVRNGISF